jgi:hypothetical protein
MEFKCWRRTWCSVAISNSVCVYSESLKCEEELGDDRVLPCLRMVIDKGGRKHRIGHCLHTDECEVQLPTLIECPG